MMVGSRMGTEKCMSLRGISFLIGSPPIVAVVSAAMLQFGAASAQKTVEIAPVEEKKPGRRMLVVNKTLMNLPFTFLRDMCHGEL